MDGFDSATTISTGDRKAMNGIRKRMIRLLLFSFVATLCMSASPALGQPRIQPGVQGVCRLWAWEPSSQAGEIYTQGGRYDCAGKVAITIQIWKDRNNARDPLIASERHFGFANGTIRMHVPCEEREAYYTVVYSNQGKYTASPHPVLC